MTLLNGEPNSSTNWQYDGGGARSVATAVELGAVRTRKPKLIVSVSVTGTPKPIAAPTVDDVY